MAFFVISCTNTYKNIIQKRETLKMNKPLQHKHEISLSSSLSLSLSISLSHTHTLKRWTLSYTHNDSNSMWRSSNQCSPALLLDDNVSVFLSIDTKQKGVFFNGNHCKRPWFNVLGLFVLWIFLLILILVFTFLDFNSILIRLILNLVFRLHLFDFFVASIFYLNFN